MAAHRKSACSRRSSKVCRQAKRSCLYTKSGKRKSFCRTRKNRRNRRQVR